VRERDHHGKRSSDKSKGRALPADDSRTYDTTKKKKKKNSSSTTRE
jgi:hypothetical protein